MQTRVLDLNDKRPNDWMLAESEYLVRMAGRKLWLEHDLVSAITLLGNADERIKALNDPSLMPIRKALAEDIAQLKGMPRIDREGLTLKLAALSDQIELLPLSTVSMPEAKSEPDQAVSTNPDEWESNLKKNWVKFTENFITIRRRDGAVEALLSRSRRSSCARTSRPSCCRPSSPSTASSRLSMTTAWTRPSAG